ITSTYLVVRTWDWRRLIVPLSWFLEQPIQNWTRETTAIIGQVHLNVDYRTPIDELRRELDRLLATASDASRAWDLRCELREKMIAYLQREHPECLPRHRLQIAAADAERS